MTTWLVKTEPSTYAFGDLVRDRRTTWDGVANPLARIHLRAMTAGDEVLVYHSGQEKAVVGLAKVVAGPRPDPKAKDARSVVVDLVPVARAATPVPLAWIKASPACRDLDLLRISRLSVMPVPVGAAAALARAAGFGAAS
jgi:predicted RNA-binding protein with PUA-like domain